MKQLRVLSLFIVMVLNQIAFGQTKETEQALKIHLQNLKMTNVDTILIVKSGCIGCETKYDGFTKTIRDGQRIYMLTQHNKKFVLTVFDDIHSTESFSSDTCSVFKFILKNKDLLKEKTKFYKVEMQKIKSRKGFYPPKRIHYNYEELAIKSPGFNYFFELVNNSEDNYGFNRERENWFIVTREIVKRIITFADAKRNEQKDEGVSKVYK